MAQAQTCEFCGGEAGYIYTMGDYSICQCRGCGTGFVEQMPDDETLKAFYDGFLPNLEANRLPRFCEIAGLLFPRLGLKPGRQLTMLDVGGGGGFFCKAFEELGYGRGVYVDLDAQSSRFAAEQLAIDSVYNCDATRLDEVTNEKFDFIYCRHLIEHLTQPTVFLRRVLSLLKDNGIFVVQFPNGDSLEYLAYTHLNIGYRFNKIRESSGFSRTKTLWTMLSGGILHGIDPPRHLWAVSRKAMSVWTQNNNIGCRMFTCPLGDLAFSPGFLPKKSILGKLRDFAGQKLLAPMKGGTHAVAILTRDTSASRSRETESNG